MDALAATVCVNDPRSTDQRRSDACGALARGEAGLTCQCGHPDCAPGVQRRAAQSAVIHVLAEQATLNGGPKPGHLTGFGVLPAQCVRDLAENATPTPLTVPSGTPDAGYRPSATTLEFLRWRDLTCRWPGCDKPAQKCDIDHTVAWPSGPTHPSNLKPYCRNPPLRRGDGEEAPLTGHTLELIRAALLELEP